MIVGIDLGTTNSLIGIYDGQGPQLIPNALGDLLTPSAVSIDDDGKIIIGRAARDRLVSHPAQSVATFKRWMGTSREVSIGGRKFRPEELSALVLRSLVADVESATGQKVNEAVISVPAYFGDAQRKATKTAGEMAGIRVERLINEPTAAALAYGLDERLDGTTFVVLDLGGGTFDVSILEVFDGVMKVHASAGDNLLGGENFVDVLVEACCQDLGLKPSRLPARDISQIHLAMERLKRELSSSPESKAHFIVDSNPYQWTVTEERFSTLADPFLQRIRKPIERAMRDARLSPADLAEVVLVGGASRMPIIAKLASKMFGRLPLRHVNPDEAIARGACVAAAMKARHQSLEEVVMTDVCPYTLGVGVSIDNGAGGISSGHFSPVIERNQAVPISRSNLYSPIRDSQPQLNLEVFQGESPYVVNNVRLGTLEIPLPLQSRRDETAVEVRFTYDINGVLQVEATVLSTGNRVELILRGNESSLTDAQIRERFDRLAALKVHPRDDQENIATIARAERIYQHSLGADRDLIQTWLVRFQVEIDRQNQQAIAEFRGGFNNMLDQLDARRY